MKLTKTSGATLAAAAATMMLAGSVTAPTTGHAADYKVKCFGLNACKGTGSCKSTGNGCKGQNACKGQGVKMMSKSACVAKGGKTSRS